MKQYRVKQHEETAYPRRWFVQYKWFWQKDWKFKAGFWLTKTEAEEAIKNKNLNFLWYPFHEKPIRIK